MIYRGYFSDYKDHKYYVDIITENSRTDVTEILLTGDAPVVMSQYSSEGIYTPIKSRSLSISILTESMMPQLVSQYNHGNKVELYEYVGNDRTLIFDGYVTPALYNAPYANMLDHYTVEAVDSLSTLKNIDYTTIRHDEETVQSLYHIIRHILDMGDCGDDCWYAPTLYVGEGTDPKILHNLYISESNFFQDDDAHTPLSCYEVLSEILRFVGFSAVREGASVYLLDYDQMAKTYDTHMVDGPLTRLVNNVLGTQEISGDDYLGSDSNISFDDVYNKIIISQNAYDLDDVTPDLFDTNNLECLTLKDDLGSGGVIYTKNSWKYFFWFRWDEEYQDYIDYKTFFLLKPEAGFRHYFYNAATGAEVNNYDDGVSFKSWNVNNTFNTQCCIVTKHAGVSSVGNSKPPTSLSWANLLTFFTLNDSTEDLELEQYPSKLMLEYEGKDFIQWSPKGDDRSFIKIKGDLFYQQRHDKFALESDHSYTVTPMDGMPDLEAWNPVLKSGNVKISGETREANDPYYGAGWPLLRMYVCIDDGQTAKYWNGSAWTSTFSTFYINYNNAPAEGAEENKYCLTWLSPVPNVSYTDKIGDDCFAIPITAADNLRGKLKWGIYNPDSLIKSSRPTGQTFYWADFFPVTWMKDFKVEFTFANDDLWYIADTIKAGNEDLVFENIVDSDIISSDNAVELKCNSYVKMGNKKSRLSKSHVLTQNGYLDTVFDSTAATTDPQLQEINLLNRRYEHYSSPKMVYSTTLDDYRSLLNNYTFTTPGLEDKKFIIDSYQWDIRDRKNTITFVEV